MVLTPGRIGQFDVTSGDKTIVTRGGNFLTRMFGAGYPDFDEVVEKVGQVTNDAPAE